MSLKIENTSRAEYSIGFYRIFGSSNVHDTRVRYGYTTIFGYGGGGKGWLGWHQETVTSSIKVTRSSGGIPRANKRNVYVKIDIFIHGPRTQLFVQPSPPQKYQKYYLFTCIRPNTPHPPTSWKLVSHVRSGKTRRQAKPKIKGVYAITLRRGTVLSRRRTL